MESALIVSGTQKGVDVFGDMLRQCGGPVPSAATNGGEARRMLLAEEYDLVVINAPLTDEFGHELAVSVAENSLSGVILVVKNELVEELSARVESAGVFVVPKPISRPFFYQAVRLVEASRRRILGLSSENVRLKGKIEEMRLVDRAKCALIQYLNMTEPQAHRYIEKQAMDLRLQRRQVAENILKTYET